jgi:outer membrane biosynthesis protein TonB
LNVLSCAQTEKFVGILLQELFMGKHESESDEELASASESASESVSDETVESTSASESASESESKEKKGKSKVAKEDKKKKSKSKKEEKPEKKKKKTSSKKEEKPAKKKAKKEEKPAKKASKSKKEKPEKKKKKKSSSGETSHRNSDMKTPFRETSILGKGWALAIKGSSVKEITKYAKKEGSNPQWLLRALRRKKRFGWTWKVQEENGKFKIFNAKRP